jgi:hypothetical protein
MNGGISGPAARKYLMNKRTNIIPNAMHPAPINIGVIIGLKMLECHRKFEV